MQDDPFLVVRFIFVALFVVTLFLGGYLVKNYQRLFGVDPSMPSENDSARTYSKVQIISVWVHALILTGAFALLLH